MKMKYTAALLLFAFTLASELCLPSIAATADKHPGPNESDHKYTQYILGPGDTVYVELLNIPELSGSFTIGPDGILYVPRLRALVVEGLTVDELSSFLKDQYKVFIKDPQVFVRPVAYRPVRVYVGGEIRRPGYYYLLGEVVEKESKLTIPSGQFDGASTLFDAASALSMSRRPDAEVATKFSGTGQWPTLFDAIRTAGGVTPNSNLSQVRVTRKRPLGAGGGKVQAEIDFLKFVTDGDDYVNIRLYDGDNVTVKRSPSVMREQLLAATKTNLSPDFIEVFVSGRVRTPGARSLPQGSTLNQAIASAGGTKLLKGGIEFLRFNSDGSTDRRTFSYKESAKPNDPKNPVLMTGDIIRVNESILSASVEILNEITGPAVGIYSVYSLFKP